MADLNFGQSFMRPDQERILSSFNFIDIATKRAVTQFYAGFVSNGEIPDYTLSNVQFTSEKTSERTSVTSVGAFTIGANNDHATLIEVPITIEGDVTMNIPLAVDSSDVNNAHAFVSGGLFISGSTVQVLGNISSAIIDSTGTTENEIKTSMQMTIPRTRIKKGEYLIWRISTWGSKDSAGTAFLWYGFDPNGTASHQTTNEFDFGSTHAYNNSQASIFIPIQIDI